MSLEDASDALKTMHLEELPHPEKPETSLDAPDHLHVPAPDTALIANSLPVEEAYVEVPFLPDLETRKYKHWDDWDYELSDQDADPEEVIGEYDEDGISYIFARHANDQVRRYVADRFTSEYEALYQDFERRKAEGNASRIDFSSKDIHPRSRVRFKFTLNAGKKTIGVAKSKRGARVLSDDDFDEAQDASDAGSELTDVELLDGKKTTAVVSHGRKKTVKALPFSPKKTRSGKAFIAESEGDSDVEETMPARRSTRARKSARGNLRDAANLDELDLIADESDESVRPKPKRRERARPRAARPAYGHFRSVEELDYDPYSDDETIPLRQHRSVCEKCQRKPTHLLIKDAKKGKPGRRKKSKESDDDDEDDTGDVDKLAALGGWVRCLKCPVSAHWGCLARSQQDEIMKAVREKDRAQHTADPSSQDDQDSVPKKRMTLEVSETTEFLCGSCTKGGICMGCMEPVVDQQSSSLQATNAQSPGLQEPRLDKDGDVEMKDRPSEQAPDSAKEDNRVASDKVPGELLFRCVTCKRIAHYAHMPVPGDLEEENPSAVGLAEYYQDNTKWLCADCVSYTFALDKILAWRPYPATAVEPPHPKGELPNYKNNLPREYLVKWVDRSYRRLAWVPHMWLATMYGQRLKNFLETGSKVVLLAKPVRETTDQSMAISNDEETKDSAAVIPGMPPPSLPDAEKRIPLPWKTADRVLDALFWCPGKRDGFRKKPGKKQKGYAKSRIVEDSEEDSDNEKYADERDAAFSEGDQPSADLTETLDEWEERTGKTLSAEHAEELSGRVVWAFIKWDDMGYDEATWDSPPRKGEFGWEEYRKAFQRLIESRSVVVLSDPKTKSTRAPDGFRKRHAFKEGDQPSLGQDPGLALMPFQVDGLNWLCNNWWNLQHCILADEMGLGKTVQIATFIGTIAENWQAFPALIVVPNSTITNWVREFERWAPKLRVVPFYGEAKSREVIKHYELTHTTKRSKTTGIKYHVLVTTYDTVTNPKDFASVFKGTPRWEVLVVDEGQRLKGEGSLLFKKLTQLNAVHRVLMTGTPLNNNMRELFNLMNFLDPKEWNDLEALEQEYETLTEDLVKQLHTRLRPYFLRRTKGEVLPLPPKNEVIVPVSMSPLQKEIYRSILSQNFQVLQSLTQASKSGGGSAPKSSMRNMLMQLRKCLQHPYLVSDDIEPRGLPPAETHERLISGSAKLRLLKNMLPKLKARGHRVLLFSQFVIALNVIEDFLVGEGYKYLRLDGDTKQADRQKGMDAFNKPGSDVFIYILSTRAGGVGINLWSADTVIIFDPDFNPHQDLQAIARSHRFGQTKPCLVFKLLVKESAEERIMQAGKKKLVLDHLIVQKMDDDEEGKEDVQSILMFGAKALFEGDTNDSSRDINYTDQDLEKLIEKTEQEGQEEDQTKQKDSGLFAFAKVWSADKDSFEELPDAGTEQQDDSWAQTLRKIEEEREKEQTKEVTGRGARRRNALIPQQQLKDLDLDDSPAKEKKRGRKKFKSKATDDESDAYTGSVPASESDDEEPDEEEDTRALSPLGEKEKMSKHQHQFDSKAQPLMSVENQRLPGQPVFERCGLCGLEHAPSSCYMTESSENLAEYRRMLLIHADDEPIEDRRAAIQVIDETLWKRNHLHLIHGQPLLLLNAPSLSHKHKVKSPNMPAGVSTSAKAGPSNAATSSSALAGPSKRPPSPLPSTSSKKSKHTGGQTPCSVCGRSPHHLVKDCPVVAEGPKSTAREIARLERDPKQSHTVDVLRKIMIKQKKREAAAQIGRDPAMPMVID
ncbi:hypothetical protein OE88DRAFT_1730039 [Heliocybe sulcata]|uniref:Uncharacterized protein n=1 Tax=Heliocybe sulcata TaxID=5364 RepID=A0A5C3NF83_9AGAM|nr:hypothetical protein OE88DRAFT_1730039 [Heliocybe sulcata]